MQLRDGDLDVLETLLDHRPLDFFAADFFQDALVFLFQRGSPIFLLRRLAERDLRSVLNLQQALELGHDLE